MRFEQLEDIQMLISLRKQRDEQIELQGFFDPEASGMFDHDLSLLNIGGDIEIGDKVRLPDGRPGRVKYFTLPTNPPFGGGWYIASNKLEGPFAANELLKRSQ